MCDRDADQVTCLEVITVNVLSIVGIRFGLGGDQPRKGVKGEITSSWSRLREFVESCAFTFFYGFFFPAAGQPGVSRRRRGRTLRVGDASGVSPARAQLGYKLRFIRVCVVHVKVTCSLSCGLTKNIWKSREDPLRSEKDVRAVLGDIDDPFHF